MQEFKDAKKGEWHGQVGYFVAGLFNCHLPGHTEIESYLDTVVCKQTIHDSGDLVIEDDQGDTKFQALQELALGEDKRADQQTTVLSSFDMLKNGGRSSYRGLVKVEKGAHNSKSNVVCDALILDPESRSDTYPYIEIAEQDVSIGHEASVSRIGEEQLFYLMSRGLSEAEASTMIVNGFIEPLVKELPMEYAVEMNRLIQLQMEGSVG